MFVLLSEAGVCRIHFDTSNKHLDLLMYCTITNFNCKKKINKRAICTNIILLVYYLYRVRSIAKVSSVNEWIGYECFCHILPLKPFFFRKIPYVFEVHRLSSVYKSISFGTSGASICGFILATCVGSHLAFLVG